MLGKKKELSLRMKFFFFKVLSIRREWMTSINPINLVRFVMWNKRKWPCFEPVTITLTELINFNLSFLIQEEQMWPQRIPVTYILSELCPSSFWFNKRFKIQIHFLVLFQVQFCFSFSERKVMWMLWYQ